MNDPGRLYVNSLSGLKAGGRRTTEDCDSRFLIDSDAHAYRFELVQDARVRGSGST